MLVLPVTGTENRWHAVIRQVPELGRIERYDQELITRYRSPLPIQIAGRPSNKIRQEVV